MSKSIEIEFKNLLTEEEFTQFKNYLNISDDMFVKQENHYFDTADFFLKEKSSALRIRRRHGEFELTLKEPAAEGLLETNQSLSNEEANNILQGKAFIDGPVKERLVELQLPFENLQYFGTLTTNRAEKEYNGGLIVLDYSTYLNHSDFEVEYEVSNFESGSVIFHKLLAKLEIPVRKTQNKIHRFFNAKYKEK